MYPVVWRVVPLAVPAWATRCVHCHAPGLECTGRFRVNSNGPLSDVWLLYRCPACGRVRKRSIHRRVREGPGLLLERYRRNDAEAAALWAFALSRGAPVAYAVERPGVRGPGLLSVRIDQPFPCAVRWDALLAREIGDSRSRVRAAWRSGAVVVAPVCRPAATVRHGQRIALRLDGIGRLVSSGG